MIPKYLNNKQSIFCLILCKMNFKNYFASMIKFNKPSRTQIKINENNSGTVVEEERFLFGEKFHQCSSVISTTISDYRIMSKWPSSKSFTTYIIKVQTSDLIFQVEKRFSEFAIFHQELTENCQHRFDFPTKTFLYSGTNLQVIESRIRDLNRFLQSVLTIKDNSLNIYFKLLKFLEVEQEYEKYQFKLREQIKKIDSRKGFLINQLILMNKVPHNAVEHVENIQMYILEGKAKKFKNQEIKETIIGNSQWRGIVEFCLQIENQLTQKELIMIISRLISPITNHNSELVQKYLCLIPIAFLKLSNESSLENNEFRTCYFELLAVYSQKNDNFNPQQILSQKKAHIFKEWKAKVQKLKSQQIYRNREKFCGLSPIEFKANQKTKSKIKRQYEEANKVFEMQASSLSKFKLIEMASLEKKSLNLTLKRSEDRSILKFELSTKLDFDQCVQKLLTERWNNLIIHSKVDELTNLLKQTWKVGKKQQKTLIFQQQCEQVGDRKISTQTTDELEKKNDSKSRYTIVKKPPFLSTAQSYQSYFQRIVIDERDIEVMVWIWMYFHEQGMKKYLQTEIEGKSRYIWDGLVKEFS